MAIFRVRLKDSSGEARIAAVSADSQDEANAIVEEQEAGHVAFVLDDVAVQDFEKKLKEGTLSGRDKARLFSHRQTRPYKVESVKGADS